MRKFSYSIHNKKGFTLIETIIALAIMSIIIVFAYSIFQFGNKTYSVGTKQYDVQSDVRLVSDYIVNNVRFATSISLISAPDSPNLSDNYSYIYIQDNKLFHYKWNGSSHDFLTFGEDIDSYSFESKKVDKKEILLLEIKAGNGKYDIKTEIELPNLGIKEEYFEGTNNVIKYSTSALYAYNGPSTSTTPPETPSPSLPTPTPTGTPDPSLPTPTPTSEYITVKIVAPHNNYSVKFNNAEVLASGSPPRDFIINNVPINTSYEYVVKDSNGIVVDEGVIEVHTEDYYLLCE